MRANIKNIVIGTCVVVSICLCKYVDYKAQRHIAYADKFCNPISQVDQNGNAPAATDAITDKTNSTIVNDIMDDEQIQEIDLTTVSNLYDIVEQEAYEAKLKVVYANILIDTESSFRANAHNSNKSSYDSGAAQLNNKGEPLNFYLGKTLKLADGREVKVTMKNYKQDARLNIAMGLRRYKYYLELVGGDPFAAYAVYNIGPSITPIVKDKHGPVDVITAVRKHGNSKGANNLKNNYWCKFKKWMGANE